MYVLNSKEEKEPFSLKKVYKAVKRVGVSNKLAKDISFNIRKEAYSGIKTSEISKKVKKLLSKEFPQSFLKFNLKDGMKKLGPTGFLFEKYIGEIFQKKGFEVKLNQHIPGLCSIYEIDFLAKKDDLLYIGECKYRNLSGKRIHLETSLANYARFLDIKNGNFLKRKIYKGVKVKSLLCTNTKFTSNVIRYSQCIGADLLGWRYPKNRGLEYLIDSGGFYPITILPSFRNYLAPIFVARKMMLAQNVLKINAKKFARETKIPTKILESLIREAKVLLG